MIERHEEEHRDGGWDGKWSDEETEVGIKNVVEGASEEPRVGERVEKEGCNP